MNENFQHLAQSLQKEFPDARVEVDFFDLGGALLAFNWRGRWWDFEYQPAWGWGVVEVKEGHDFSLHQDAIFSDFERAKHHFMGLIFAICREKIPA